jgi:hypothetical protein
MTARDRDRGSGRPPKFDEPCRPVTLTLPERTLLGLVAVDRDRARAIVKLVDMALQLAEPNGSAVEVVEVAPGAAIILVPPSRSLRRIPWLRLAEVKPRRYLLTIAPGTAVATLEVAILDLLEGLAPGEDYERRILEELRQLIGTSRREEKISKFEMLYVLPPDKKVSVSEL